MRDIIICFFKGHSWVWTRVTTLGGRRNVRKCQFCGAERD
jgi:hypothetical protein